MALSLFKLSVNSYLQTLGGISNCLELGRAHFRKNGIDPDEIVETCLFPDMKSFNYQVQAITHHSVGGFGAIKGGTYLAVLDVPSRSYSELQKMIFDAQETLRQATPDEVNGREDEDVLFRFGDFTMPFTAEDFLLSFSLPNLAFHATTTYDILRMKGVPIGKRDYLGQIRIKC